MSPYVNQALFSITLCATLVIGSGAQARADQSAKDPLLDRMLAESDTLPTHPPRAFQKELAQLPSAKKLMARVLASPKACEYFTRAALDSKRSTQQRIYALFLTTQSSGTWADDSPGVRAIEIYNGTKDPLLRAAAWRYVTNLQYFNPHRHLDQDQLRKYEELPDGNPWFAVGVGLQLDWNVRIDRELMRDILEVLPANPRTRGESGPSSFAGPKSCVRLAQWFRGNAEPEAIGFLLDEYNSSVRGRRDLFMWIFRSYAFIGWPEQVEHAEKILRLAREELLRGDPGGDLDPLVRILQTSNQAEDAQTLLQALRQAPPGERRDFLRGSIIGIVENGLWRRDVPLDPSLFPAGVPKPPRVPIPPPPRKPAFQSSPKELLRDPYPALRESPGQSDGRRERKR